MSEAVTEKVYEVRIRVRIEDEQGPNARTTPSSGTFRTTSRDEALILFGEVRATLGTRGSLEKGLLRDKFRYDLTRVHNAWIDSVDGLYEVTETKIA